jgi:tetratricopeptide (TPR) repeat protein
MTLALPTIIALACVASAIGTATPDGVTREGVTYHREQSASGKEPARRPQKKSPEGARYYVLGNGNSARNPERAVEYYKTAVENGYDTLELRLSMGILLRILERYEESAKQLRIAIQMDESDSRPHLSLAYTFVLSGRREDAIKEFEILKEVATEDYNDGIFSLDIGDCLYELGRYEEALKEYRAVLRCNCYEDADADRVRVRINLGLTQEPF